MNERLKELEKYAWDYAYDMVKGKVAFDGAINIGFSDVFSEKLAELIVKECFKAAMVESKGHMNPNDLMHAMKKNVGLE